MLYQWRKKQQLLPLLALLLGTQACFNPNDFDPERIAGVKASPSVAVPLLHGSLSIEDMLPENEAQYIEIDEDKLIHVLYSDTLYSTSIRDHFLLPNRELEKFYLTGVKTLTAGNEHTLVEDQDYVDFEYNEARFDEIHFKGGQLLLTADSNVPEDVELQLTFPTLKAGGETVVLRLVLPAGSNQQSLEHSLQGHMIDMTGFALGDNLVPVEVLATTTPEQQGQLLDMTNYVQFNLTFNELDFNLLTGFFGQHEVSLPQDELALEFFDQLFSKSRFGLKNPLLTFEFLNSNGVPVQVTKDVLQVRKSTGETLALTTDPNENIDLNYPTNHGETASTSLAVTNVSEVMDMAPDFLDYKLSGRLNVDQPQDIVNFLTDSSRSGVVFQADIPLWGWLEGLHLSDTLAMGLQPEDGQVSEDTNGGYTITDANASIRTFITNQFPLGSEVQVYFTNAQYQVADSLFADGPFLMEASKVTANGDLQSAATSTKDLPVSDKQLERMLEADHMIVKALLYTTRNADGPQPHVKIKSDYMLDVRLGLKANMNISVK